MEMARLSIPADAPMAVQQWNGLVRPTSAPLPSFPSFLTPAHSRTRRTPRQIAVNYPARAYGISRHESPAEALKKCPHLRLVHCQTYKNGETEPGYWDDPKPETHKVRARARVDGEGGQTGQLGAEC